MSAKHNFIERRVKKWDCSCSSPDFVPWASTQVLPRYHQAEILVHVRLGEDWQSNCCRHQKLLQFRWTNRHQWKFWCSWPVWNFDFLSMLKNMMKIETIFEKLPSSAIVSRLLPFCSGSSLWDFSAFTSTRSWIWILHDFSSAKEFSIWRLRVENLNLRSTKTDQFDFSVSNIIFSGRVSFCAQNIETLFTSIGKSTFATGKFCGHKVFNWRLT